MKQTTVSIKKTKKKKIETDQKKREKEKRHKLLISGMIWKIPLQTLQS